MKDPTADSQSRHVSGEQDDARTKTGDPAVRTQALKTQPKKGRSKSSLRELQNREPQNRDDRLDMDVPQQTGTALLMSIVAHVVLLVILGIVISTTPKGTGGEPDRPIGIALVHRMPDRDRYVEAKQETQTETEEQPESSSESSSAAAPPADLSPPIDLEGVLQAIEATPAPVSGTGLAGETELGDNAFGDGNGRGGTASIGEEASTMVFGVSGSGSRFVYVFDRSDSMNGHGGSPLRSAKAELIRSLRSLTKRQQFQIIFYNNKPKPFEVSGSALQLVSGESDMVERAERYVSSIRAFGGTEHESALKMALRMSPDVIFFLTDARIPRLNGTQLAEIKRRAEQGGTTIHAIEFGSEPGAPQDSFLRELASMNNGEYQYVDVRRLGQRRGQVDPVPSPHQ